MKAAQISLIVVCLIFVFLHCTEKIREKSTSVEDAIPATDSVPVDPHKWIYGLEEALQAPDSVFYLSVGGGYDEFPKEILACNNLKRLDLSMNKFEYLPEEIGKLHNLEMLWVTHGHLKELPHSIGDLKNLTKLNLLYNDLSTLPRSIGDLESLEELNLNGNPIHELPPEIFRLKRLKRLLLRTNGEKSLISEEDQQKIRAGLPDCLIVFE